MIGWIKKFPRYGSSAEWINPSNISVKIFGATAATKNLHPICNTIGRELYWANGCTDPGMSDCHILKWDLPEQWKIAGWVFYLVKCSQCNPCFGKRKNKSIKELMITEIRTIAADNLWMSTAYQQDSVAIHFTLKQHTPRSPGIITSYSKRTRSVRCKTTLGKIIYDNKRNTGQ